MCWSELGFAKIDWYEFEENNYFEIIPTGLAEGH